LRNRIGSAIRREKLWEFFGLIAILVGTSALVAAQNAREKLLPVTFTGGYETDPRDHGRPVNLIASALGVPEKVFREAFTHVAPAAAGGRPEPGQARLNKQALLRVLGPYGVTNEQLDSVSDYYRYNPERGEMWRCAPAKAFAIVVGGVVTGFKITNPGSGYSSPPMVSIPGMNGFKAKVTLVFSKRFDTNGSVSAITKAR
jgi:hypothetical protein